MTQDELKAALSDAGWRIENNRLRGEYNECSWYAWHANRPSAWPDCQCNDKPPSLIIMPSYTRLPDGQEFSGVDIDLTGEMNGRWFKLKMYSVNTDEVLQAAEEAKRTLGAAWTAIAACVGATEESK